MFIMPFSSCYSFHPLTIMVALPLQAAAALLGLMIAR